jgi:hypothetical protein
VDVRGDKREQAVDHALSLHACGERAEGRRTKKRAAA